MQLTYRFRLYPSRAQEQKLLATLDSCRWLYNHEIGREPAEFAPVEIGPLPARASLIVEAGSPVL